jgi:glyoxylase I family protein
MEKSALKDDGATHQAFVVDSNDFELAVKKMRDWGVKVYDIPIVERPTGRGLYFFDTEGNLLQLYCPPK